MNEVKKLLETFKKEIDSQHNAAAHTFSLETEKVYSIELRVMERWYDRLEAAVLKDS